MSMMETHLTRSGPVNPPVGQPASFDAWQALVAPGDVFRHPREVLAHPQLTPGEKRAILASWASDACALENAPGLRCLTGCRAEPVSVDAVLAALAQLNRRSLAPRAKRTAPRGLSNLHRYVRRRRRDDDDDPPPCPAVAMPLLRRPSGAAALTPCLTA